jgi:serine/threonine-protein kinase HipA
VDSKGFESITREQFERFAAKARLPTKLTLDTVHETVARFGETWRNSPAVLIDDHLREAIDRHLQSVPLWTQQAAGC